MAYSYIGDTSLVTYVDSRNFSLDPPSKPTVIETFKGKAGFTSFHVKLPGTSYGTNGNDYCIEGWVGPNSKAANNQSIVLGGGNDVYLDKGFGAGAQFKIVYMDAPGRTLWPTGDKYTGGNDPDYFLFGNDEAHISSRKTHLKTGLGNDTVNVHRDPMPVANRDASKVFADYTQDTIVFDAGEPSGYPKDPYKGFDITGVSWLGDPSDGIVSSFRVKTSFDTGHGKAGMNLVVQVGENDAFRAKLEGFDKHPFKLDVGKVADLNDMYSAQAQAMLDDFLIAL